MKCSECSNFMDKLNRCKFCHFEKEKSFYSYQKHIENELEKLKRLENENKLLKMVLRELL